MHVLTNRYILVNVYALFIATVSINIISKLETIFSSKNIFIYYLYILENCSQNNLLETAMQFPCYGFENPNTLKSVIDFIHRGFT